MCIFQYLTKTKFWHRLNSILNYAKATKFYYKHGQMLCRIVPLMFIWPSLFAHTCHKWPKSNAIRHGQGTIGHMKVYQLPEQSWFVWLEILEGNPANGSEDNGSIRLLVSTFCQSPFDSARFMVQSSYWFNFGWKIEPLNGFIIMATLSQFSSPWCFWFTLNLYSNLGRHFHNLLLLWSAVQKWDWKLCLHDSHRRNVRSLHLRRRVAGLFTGCLESLVSAADIRELGRHCSVFPTSYQKILRYFPFI